jgi:SAM-dependent methyltransferase
VTAFPDPWAEILPDARIVADDEVLALEEGAHDLVIHALALHWANDPVGQLIQCRRALSPDGLFLAVLFGGQTLAELRAALAEAESRLAGGLSARVLPMAEIRDLGALLQRAGFALPVADAVRRTVTYATMFHLIADLRAMGEGNALARRSRRATPRALFPEAAARYAGAYPAGDGRIVATFESIWLTGWAPHPGQQKPLRPGSAVQRLANALGATERRAGDTGD